MQTTHMPSVVERTDYSQCICGGNSVDRLPFSSTTGVIWVTLIELLDRAG
jgi:hypothetical protein